MLVEAKLANPLFQMCGFFSCKKSCKNSHVRHITLRFSFYYKYIAKRKKKTFRLVCMKLLHDQESDDFWAKHKFLELFIFLFSSSFLDRRFFIGRLLVQFTLNFDWLRSYKLKQTCNSVTLASASSARLLASSSFLFSSSICTRRDSTSAASGPRM